MSGVQRMVGAREAKSITKMFDEQKKDRRVKCTPLHLVGARGQPTHRTLLVFYVYIITSCHMLNSRLISFSLWSSQATNSLLRLMLKHDTRRRVAIVKQRADFPPLEEEVYQ